MKSGVRVLLALDEGESAREPARLLNAVFGAAPLRIRVLHVAPALLPDFYVPPGLGGLDALRRRSVQLEREALGALERRVQEIRAMGFQVETEVSSGSPLAEIRKRARLWRSDLILARPHRARIGVHRLGGVAAGLMQTAPAPVLLHRRVTAAYRVGTILAPIDFSTRAREAVAWALLFASLAGARVRLLHAYPGSSRRSSAIRHAAIEAVELERRRARRHLGRFGNPAVGIECEVVQANDAARGILDAATKGVDLVVLGSSGTSGLTAGLGSVSRRVARECPLPVLVLPSANRASAPDVWLRARTRSVRRARLSA